MSKTEVETEAEADQILEFHANRGEVKRYKYRDWSEYGDAVPAETGDKRQTGRVIWSICGGRATRRR